MKRKYCTEHPTVKLLLKWTHLLANGKWLLAWFCLHSVFQCGWSFGVKNTVRLLIRLFSLNHWFLKVLPQFNMSKNGKEGSQKLANSIKIWKSMKAFGEYSLISMRPIYYFDTWAIIWHGWHCLLISGFSLFLFVVIIKLFCTDMKIKTKTILWANAANFLQICGNLQKYWNMSNDGSSIEIIDQSHGD